MSRGKKSCRKKQNRQVHTNTAPTMQGMQQVDTWNLLQIVPLAIPLSVTYDANQPCIVQIYAGVNDWGWDVRQGGTLLTGQTLYYGEATEQFQELAALWATYRLDSVMAEFVPSQVGSGQQTSIISAIQPAGPAENFSSPVEALETVSRLRTVRLGDSRKPCRRTIDYKGWLMQVTPQAFLQTVDLSLGTGVREYYPQQLSNTAPIIRMAFQTTPGIGGPGIALGFLRFNARYSVRGRRGTVLPTSIRMGMMTTSEQEEAFAYLLETKRQDKPVDKSLLMLNSVRK